MQTADWALIISLFSLVISAASFIWNVWSKFIYPKPVIRVSFKMVQIIANDLDWVPEVLELSATNMGPGDITLSKALVKFTGYFGQTTSYGLLSTLEAFPRYLDHRRGGLGVGFPAKIAVGETYSAYLVPAHELLAKGNYQRVGFSDSFGRNHWAPRKDILEALTYIRDACDKSNIDWRGRRH
ncbi:hypothetical protein [Bradyrhizobium stylosanthis]|uniref:hypothetical protein n=1 Tax=Bradyrhizobium stylosanthis TaxID=1803665 RepID=UPI0007C4DD63|nr:hypothetical protein [Bradyrhizobium stylosanthis]